MENRTPYEMALDAIGELIKEASEYAAACDKDKKLLNTTKGFDDVVACRARYSSAMVAQYLFASMSITRLTSMQFDIPLMQIAEEARKRSESNEQ